MWTRTNMSVLLFLCFLSFVAVSTQYVNRVEEKSYERPGKRMAESSYRTGDEGTLDTVERDGGLGAAVDRKMPCANLETDVSTYIHEKKKGADAAAPWWRQS